MVYEYTYDEKKQEMRINCLDSVYGGSIEDFGPVMGVVIDRLLEVKRPVKLIMSETRNYEYSIEDVEKLLEIAYVVEQSMRLVSLKNVSIPSCDRHTAERYSFLQTLVTEIKQDPIMAYKKLVREIRHQRMNVKKQPTHAQCFEHYIVSALEPIKSLLSKTKIIQMVKPQLAEIHDRSFYSQIFHPSVRPNFMYTRFMTLPPEDGELVERYDIGESTVEIYRKPGEIRKIYHIVPPEFKLTDHEYEILDKARQYLGRHRPREMELEQPERVRENIMKINQDMIRELDPLLGEEKVKKLAEILTRYTAGLGVLELFLKDENIQDIYVNAPVSLQPVHALHNVYGECITNIIPSKEDADSWATRFKLMSRRPLDEANPVLDTEVEVKGGRARVTIITRRLSPDGIGFALRRHRFRPWTLPLFIKNRMIDPFSSAILWFLVDGGRTILIAGTRGSGKTSLLGALMIQIMPKLRIVTVEDTLELPVEYMRKIGFNIERMKSRSVITHVETELPAEEAIRTALRLGDSCLIVGEVRSKEAIALYEAMRIGALANVVAGTIHGESAYGVFDRVVNDLDVPPTSFKATDIIVICNTIKSPDGLRSFRRVVEITEVLKHWKEDPLEENGFVNLLEYDAKKDLLVPTDKLLLGESVIINNIASRVKEWKNNWIAVWNNIKLREQILKTMVELSEKNKQLLEAEAVVLANVNFHLISERVREENGFIDSKAVFNKWVEWLKGFVHG